MAAVSASPAGRRAELADRLAGVHERIARACDAAGRGRDEVRLVVVTKTFPASDVRLLSGLGVRDVGENRDQEAAPKAEACADLDLTWHFVGRLQSNKAGSVAGYAHWVHSVDRAKLAAALGRAADRAGRTLRCLVQVSLDPPDVSHPADAARPELARGGVVPAEAVRLADAIASTAGLTVGGVMGVAPPDGDPAAAFDLLAATAVRVRAGHPGATAISAGMSGDLEAAVASGATHVRVGTAVLGARPVLSDETPR